MAPDDRLEPSMATLGLSSEVDKGRIGAASVRGMTFPSLALMTLAVGRGLWQCPRSDRIWSIGRWNCGRVACRLP